MYKNSYGKVNNYIENTVHNFSFHQFSDDKLTVVSYGLDHHISNKFNHSRIHIELE